MQHATNRRLDATVGIYSTAYTLISHRDGSVSVRAPYIDWRNNNGNLAHSIVHVTDQRNVRAIKAIFAADDGLCDQDGDNMMTLDDYIYGRVIWQAA